jgi:hypothetical protein
MGVIVAVLRRSLICPPLESPFPSSFKKENTFGAKVFQTVTHLPGTGFRPWIHG